MNVGIIGGGAWGCALATLVAGAGHLARIGTRGARPTGFASTPNIDALARESELLIMAVPSDSAAEAVDAVRPDAGSMVLFAGRGMNTREVGGCRTICWPRRRAAEWVCSRALRSRPRWSPVDPPL